MTIEGAISKIHDIGIVPVVRAANLDEARRAVDAIFAGGIHIIEITMTVPNAPEVIHGLVQHYGSSLLTGAGTVTSAAQAQTCIDAGAQFLVSPGLSVPSTRNRIETRNSSHSGSADADRSHGVLLGGSDARSRYFPVAARAARVTLSHSKGLFQIRA